MNSKWHFYISVVKSVVRILGCASALVFSKWEIVAVALGLAEVLGIVEEVGDKR